jgi:hypothetical protein
MPVKLIQTTISETSISMRYADDADTAMAQEWIEFKVKISELRSESGTPIFDTRSPPLGGLQRAALLRVREELSHEIPPLPTI